MVYGLSPDDWRGEVVEEPGRTLESREKSDAATSRLGVGVTSTPVIDPSTGVAYLTHKTYASGLLGAGPLVHGCDRNGDRHREVRLPGRTERHRTEPTWHDLPADQRRCSAPGCCCSTASSTPASAHTATPSRGRDGFSASRPAVEIKARWVAVPSGRARRNLAIRFRPLLGQPELVDGGDGQRRLAHRPDAGQISPGEPRGVGCAPGPCRPMARRKPVDFFAPFDAFDTGRTGETPTLPLAASLGWNERVLRHAGAFRTYPSRSARTARLPAEPRKPRWLPAGPRRLGQRGPTHRPLRRGVVAARRLAR